MTITIKLDTRKSEQTAEGSPVIVYFSRNYEQKRWRIGYFSKGTHWNDKLAEPRQKHPNYYVVNDKVKAFKERISDVLNVLNREYLSSDEIKARIFKKSFKVFYDAVIDITGDEAYTDTRYSAITAFNEQHEKLTYHEITRDIVSKWIQQRLSIGKKPSGVDSYVRSLRKLWNDLSDLENPFSSHRIEIPEKIQPASTNEDLVKMKNAKLSNRKNAISGPGHYRNYWMLMFYLGGIDPEVLIKLRYDEHVVNGRINFNRDKGQSKAACSNLIPDEALEILQQYDCKPYLVPIYKSKNTNEFIKNMSSRMKVYLEDLELAVDVRAKSARHTFIDRAQQLFIDDRLLAQLVGHKIRTSRSVYGNTYPREVQDKAHLKIIDLLQT